MDCDILVIGAGVLGLSSAYYLKARYPSKRVIVIDRYGSAGQGSTAKSAGGFRNMFDSRENQILAESTVGFLADRQREGADVGLHYTGYLYLYSDVGYRKAKPALERMESRGVQLKVHDPRSLKVSLPRLVTDFAGDDEAELMGLRQVTVGVQGLHCGTIDADAVARLYETLFLRAGGEIRYNTRATRLIMKPRLELGLPGEPFVWQDAAVAGVETDKGGITAEATVVAGGVWSETLLNGIGFETMMRSRKRMIFSFNDPKLAGLLDVGGFNEHRALPLTQLTEAKVYLKPDLAEGGLWLGVTEDVGRRFQLEDDPQPEETIYSGNAYYALCKYLPCFRDVRPVNSWAGLRAVNTVDKVPVVAPGPGFIYVGSDNGTGITKCDALGRVVSSLYSGDSEADLYGGRKLKVESIGIARRSVERESF